jgi:hypothetical protein
MVFIACAAMAPPSLAAGNVNFILGQKMLDKDDWDPLEDQPEFGAQITVGGADWPVHIAIDVIGSLDEETVFGEDVTGSTVEVAPGVRKIWGKNKTHPFVGGGIALVQGEVEVFSVSFDDTGTGYWIDGGVFWRLGPRFNIGFDARWSSAKIDFDVFGDPINDVEAGGEHLGLLLGWGW